MRVEIDVAELRVWEIMKRTVGRLYGDGEVVLDLKHSSNFLPGKCHHGGGFLVGGQVLIGVEDDGAYLIWLRVSPVKRQVAANKSSFALDHVTVRALCFAKEERLSLFRVAGKLDNISSPLENPQVADNIRYFLGLTLGEAGHP